MKIAGKTILQGELVDVLECEKCGARWTNQLMDCYHCAASLNDYRLYASDNGQDH